MGSKDLPTIKNPTNPELYLESLVSRDLGDLLVTDKESQLEDRLPPKGQSQVPAVGVKCLSLLVLITMCSPTQLAHHTCSLPLPDVSLFILFSVSLPLPHPRPLGPRLVSRSQSSYPCLLSWDYKHILPIPGWPAQISVDIRYVCERSCSGLRGSRAQTSERVFLGRGWTVLNEV